MNNRPQEQLSLGLQEIGGIGVASQVILESLRHSVLVLSKFLETDAHGPDGSCINGTSQLIVLFNVEGPIPSATSLSEISTRASAELLKATKALTETKDPSRFCAGVKALAEEAEEVYLRGQEILMANAPEPSSLIKHQRICERLEAAVNLSQEVARTIERIAIKHL